MVDRGFNETDLRVMLESVTRIAPNTEADRWVASSRLERRDWEIIVEPSFSEKRLVVITAYPSE